MEGVTILSEDTALIGGFSILYLIFAAVFVIGFILGLIALRRDWSFTATVLSLIVFLTGAIMVTVSPIITAKRVKTYKVTIDDSVSFTEFTDKYEIKDQEGKIFTIYEKNSLDQA